MFRDLRVLSLLFGLQCLAWPVSAQSVVPEAVTEGAPLPAPVPVSRGGVSREAVLVVPDFGKETVLLDDQGKEILSWKSENTNAGGARLLKDRSLLHVVNRPLQRPFRKAILGGGLEILDAESRPVWRFLNATSEHASCGDALMLPNGNVLTMIMEWKSKEDVIKAGRDASLVDDNGMLVPGLMEVKPNGPTAGIPVWKWSLWNHLYQQAHPALANYSFPKGKEGCMDINQGQQKRRGWIQPLEIDYNEKDQLILVTFQNRQAWVIDHSTTTAEAATDKGGKSGKGGRLLQKLAFATAPDQKSVPVMSAWWEADSSIGVLRPNSTFAQLLKQENGAVYRVGTHAGAGDRQITFPAKDGKKINVRNARFLTDGSLVMASGFAGQIVRLSKEGEVLWMYENTRGMQSFNVGAPDGSTGCCGGGIATGKETAKAQTPNIAQTPPEQPKKIQSAPVSRMLIYPSPSAN